MPRRRLRSITYIVRIRSMSKRRTVTGGSDTATLSPETASEVLKALANPNRLRILLRLREACPMTPRSGTFDVCVGDVSAALDISPSTVSHHLKELERVGLLRMERRGKKVLCRVSCRPLIDVVQLLDCRSADAGAAGSNNG